MRMISPAKIAALFINLAEFLIHHQLVPILFNYFPLPLQLMFLCTKHRKEALWYVSERERAREREREIQLYQCR
jgi:hypothetical protein